MARNKKRALKNKRSTPTAQSQENQRIALTTLSLPYLRELGAKTGSALNPKEQADLSASLETLTWLLALIADKNLTLTRLRRALFGNGSESIENLLASLGSQEPLPAEKSEPEDDLTPAPEPAGPTAVPANENAAPEGQGPERNGNPPTGTPAPPPGGNPKGKGHGRTGAGKYTGAKRCSVSHGSLTRGAACPECGHGKVYPLSVPAILVRIEGIGPLVGTVYELQRLRCSSCGRVFTARPPEGIGVEKYDSSVTALVSLLRYGCGMPFHRLSRLQAALGLPLPSSTAFELVEAGADSLETLYEALTWEAAQGQTLHNDDTWIKILKLPEPLEPDDGRDRSERTGLFTSGILSEVGGRRVALYFTGRQHAGENIREVLLRRAEGLDPPVQMSDASSSNKPRNIETIAATCLAHARRNFVDIAESFPDEVQHVLTQLARVYHVDSEARRAAMSEQERLVHHQTHSTKAMEDLRLWMTKRLEDKDVEPNSGLGKAFNFMLKRWDTFTVFLRVPGAPLDNNVVERSLKRAILHRKNSLFFKTWNGARVSDFYMSLIHTCELNGQEPVSYLRAVLDNAAQVELDPSAWLPWNWKAAISNLKNAPDSLSD